MDGGAEIERLEAAAAGVAIGKPLLNVSEDIVVPPDGTAKDQRLCIFEGLADALAARHFANTGSDRRVLRDHNVSGETGLGAAEVE